MRQMRIFQGADLQTVAGYHILTVRAEPTILGRLLLKKRSRISCGQRAPNGVRVNLLGEANCFSDRILRLARQAYDEGVMYGDAEFMTVLHEPPGPVRAHALFDFMLDLFTTRLKAHQQQAQAIVLHDLERLVRYARLGIPRPGHTDLAQQAHDDLGARPVVRERIVIEKVSFNPREIILGARDSPAVVSSAANPIPSPLALFSSQCSSPLGVANAVTA
jgi:hypothetical protein